MSDATEILFDSRTLADYLGERETNMLSEIDRTDEEEILETEIDELVAMLKQKYRVELPLIRQEGAILHEEYKPEYKSGTEARYSYLYTYDISYKGDATFFHLQPSQYSLKRPEAKVVHGKILLTLRSMVHTSYTTLSSQQQNYYKVALTKAQEKLALINRHMAWMAEDVAEFHEHLEEKARLQILQVRKRVLREQKKNASTASVNDAVRNDAEVTPQPAERAATGKRIFIGHGHSHAWRDLKDFLRERLGLEHEEFNREPTAGVTTAQRLEDMLNNTGFAFLVLTAEDEHGDATRHPRLNVVHELGLFQGRLGFKKAIVLLEEGCAEFSNIHGLTRIQFPKNNIQAVFEEIRRVLEREKLA